ncbi:unnamed protein product [Pneumocystis jirovecii]|uniref:Uncharacterized protein n=1 Tax=Pneumocystis jirovecii TaxID=42068 RepID=L0P8J5_PNEJI|nr:unnamed protein product [Pneumocystis jirovecii]
MEPFPSKKAFYKDIFDKKIQSNDKWESGNGFESKHLRSEHSEIYQDDWYPKTKYVEVAISALSEAFSPIALKGRIVNVYHTNIEKNSERSLLIIYLKDEVDVIKVKYWLNKKNVKAIHNMLTIDTLCAVFVIKKHTDKAFNFDFKNVLTVPFYLVVSDDNETTHISVFKDQDKYYKKPLKIQKNGTIEGLMSLLTFVSGGYKAISKPKVLVSIQKIGNLRNHNMKKGASDRIELKVFDNTYDAIFILWGNNAKSATLWKPFDTMLLLTNISLSFYYGKAYLTFEKHSIIEINPDIDMEPLRKYSDVIKNKLSNISKLPFLEDGTINASFATMFYTLAEIDNIVRLKPNESIIGFINVLITKTAKLSAFRSFNKIFIGKCCGETINTLDYNIKCSNCNQKIRIIRLLDESAQLLYPILSATLDLYNSTDSELDYFSEMILYSRISFVFGVEINDNISKIILTKIFILKNL